MLYWFSNFFEINLNAIASFAFRVTQVNKGASMFLNLLKCCWYGFWWKYCVLEGQMHSYYIRLLSHFLIIFVRLKGLDPDSSDNELFETSEK